MVNTTDSKEGLIEEQVRVFALGTWYFFSRRKVVGFGVARGGGSDEYILATFLIGRRRHVPSSG